MSEKAGFDNTATGKLWTLDFADSPVLATAIHDGHDVRSEINDIMALSSSQRLREEDPFTGDMIRDLENRIIVHRSRFETDLNRAKPDAVYSKPEQSWGLEVWNRPLSSEEIDRSLSFHDDYYATLETVLKRMEKRHGQFVVLDIHSYNHRRGGPASAPTPQAEAPDINIGTWSMDTQRWSNIITALGQLFASRRIKGRLLDVRENVAFQGKGEQTRFIHERFPQTGCAIAVEFKKIFMDEWTGEPDHAAIGELRELVSAGAKMLETLMRDAR